MRQPLCGGPSRALLVLALFAVPLTSGCASARGAAHAGAAPAAPVDPPALIGHREVEAPPPVLPEEKITEEIRRVDPAFRQTVREYDKEMAILTTQMSADQNGEMRRAIVLLADAIECVPHAESVDLAAAATQIRMARHEPFFAAQMKMTPAEEHQRALVAIAKALNDIAFGPYDAATEVGEKVRAFQDAVDRLGNPMAEGRSDEKVLDALLEAKRALRSILLAAAAMEPPV